MSADTLPGVDLPATDRACPTCHRRDYDALHLVRCAHLTALADDVEARAAACGIPAVTARDLFAHLHGLHEDGELARRAVLAVVDLGWRPVIGSEADRLWRAEL